MLVLKRRREQSVRIGPDVTVKVLAIQNGAVTLAIEAPAWLKISRGQASEATDNSVAATPTAN